MKDIATIVAHMVVPKPNKACGSHFYKYSSPERLERLRDIILQHRIYIPTIGELNDPADGRPIVASMSEDKLFSFLHLDFLRRNPHLTSAAHEKEALRIRYNIRSHGPEPLRRVLAEILNRHLEGFRIYSMSKRYDNLSLWAKYASNHSGYCLEFANEGGLFEHAKEVIYGDTVQMDVMNPEHRSGYWFFCKRPEWSNEEEVRLVAVHGTACKTPINPRWLTRLILGMHMSDANQKSIHDWVRQRRPELVVVSAHYDQLDQKLTLNP